MAIHVPQQKDEIVSFLRKAFSDYFSFDVFLAAGLSALIDDVLEGRLAHNYVTIKLLMDRYSSPALDKNASDQMKILLCSSYLALVQHRKDFANIVVDRAELIHRYPSFAEEDAQEISYLLIFRNLLAIALTFVPAKGNKILLIKMIERLEGSNNEYVTGSGQKPAVTRRVIIYETEGSVKAKRKSNEVDSSLAKRTMVDTALPSKFAKNNSHSSTHSLLSSVSPEAIISSSFNNVLGASTKAANERILEEAMVMFPTLQLQRMGTFDYDYNNCCDVQPDLTSIMKEFAYSGAITEDVFGILREFEDTNLAKWA